MSKQFYFYNKWDEMCHTKDVIIETMEENGVTSKEVYRADRCRDGDMFFCKLAGAIGDKGTCGKLCDYYKPRNGKAGICIHNRYTYELGEIVTIKIK